MTYRGRVKNGVVVPEAGVNLPEGAEVSIDVAPEVSAARPAAAGEGEAAPAKSTLYDRYKSIIGSVKDLPPDFAANHDHYIHGQPKRE